MNFIKTAQGNESNLLTAAKTRLARPDNQYADYGCVKSRDNANNEIVVKIEDPEKTAQISERSKYAIASDSFMLLDLLMAKYTNYAMDEFMIRMSMDEYMDVHDLKSKPTAYRQAQQEMAFLNRIQFKTALRKGEKVTGVAYTGICANNYGFDNGYLFFEIRPEFLDIMQTFKFMYLNTKTFQLDMRKNPHSYHISRYIDLNYKMNGSKISGEFINIRQLVNQCPFLPTEAEVPKKKKEKIAIPFLRDLDAIGIEYELLDKDKQPIDKDNYTYRDFIEGKLKVNYEKHKEIIEELIKNEPTSPLAPESYL